MLLFVLICLNVPKLLLLFSVFSFCILSTTLRLEAIFFRVYFLKMTPLPALEAIKVLNCYKLAEKRNLLVTHDNQYTY